MTRRRILAIATLWLTLALASTAASAGVLPVNQHYQEMDQWCWAGSSQAILEFYSVVKTQTQIAAYGTEGVNTWNWLGGESSNPTRRGINLILNYFASLPSTIYNSHLPLTAFQSQIDAWRPFVVRWGWDTGGGHFVVAHGLTGTAAYLMDPWDGPTINDYTWVVSGNSHTWTDTLTVDRSGTPPTPAPTPTPEEFNWSTFMPALQKGD